MKEWPCIRVTSIERDNSVVFVVSVHLKSALPNDLIGSTSASENLLSLSKELCLVYKISLIKQFIYVKSNGYRFVADFQKLNSHTVIDAPVLHQVLCCI